MYTVDCLYLNRAALKLKKNLRTTEKVFSLDVCNVSFIYYIETQHYLKLEKIIRQKHILNNLH